MKYHIFEENERTLLGLFNNAIIRNNDSFQTLQEYGVYDKKNSSKGRADLYIAGPKISILIEAKKWVSNKIECKELSEYMKKVWKQLKKYYNSDCCFNELKPYKMTLVFDYLNENPKNIDELDYDVNNNKDGINYYIVYKHKEKYLMIYGKIEK